MILQEENRKMKLRNKKTGEIEFLLFNSYPVSGDIVLEYYDENAESGYSEYCRYKTLAELNEEWEDYKPAEPLIKDEKIRKAVRAWAEALKENTIRFDMVSQGFSFGDGNVYSSINFDGFVFDLVDGKKYTIAELCGEEEE